MPAVVAAAAGGTVAAVLPPAHALTTLVVSYMLWGMCMGLSLMVIALYMHRLAVYKLPNVEVRIRFRSLLPMLVLNGRPLLLTAFHRQFTNCERFLGLFQLRAAADFDPCLIRAPVRLMQVVVLAFLPLGPLGQGAFAIMQIGKVGRQVFSERAFAHSGTAGDVLFVVLIAIGLTMWGLGCWWFAHGASTVSRTLSNIQRWHVVTTGAEECLQAHEHVGAPAYCRICFVHAWRQPCYERGSCLHA